MVEVTVRISGSHVAPSTGENAYLAGTLWARRDSNPRPPPCHGLNRLMTCYGSPYRKRPGPATREDGGPVRDGARMEVGFAVSEATSIRAGDGALWLVERR